VRFTRLSIPVGHPTYLTAGAHGRCFLAYDTEDEWRRLLVQGWLFALLAVSGKDLMMLTVAIGADNFTGGLGSAAFVAYLSSLCSRAFTATQYALLTSLMAVGRTMLSSGGGWLADHMNWASFFVLTTLLAVPGLLLLLWLSRLYPPPAPIRSESVGQA
jgi:MFS family permease